MNYDEQAAALLDEAKNAKRMAHQARRRAKSALSKLDELKSRCREFGIKLVIDGQVIVDGKDQGGS